MSIALYKRKSPPIPRLPEKILLVRSDNIGDVICTTPCFEALKQRFPKAIIAVLVCRLGEEVVQGNPFLDEIYVYDTWGNFVMTDGTVVVLNKASFAPVTVFISISFLALVYWIIKQRKNR